MIYVYKEFGITLPRTSLDQSQVGQAVSKSNLQPGDMVFFKNTYKAGISHAGIYIGNNKFLSATSSGGVSVDSINDPYYWGSKYAGARRVLDDTKAATTVLPTLPAGQYHDVTSTHWAHTAIANLGKNGVINGYDQSLFLPSNEIKRSEVAKMIAEQLGLKQNSNSVFKDVSANHWAAGYINALAHEGLIGGYEGNRFKPDAPISRGEIAALFTRVFAFTASANTATNTFTDVPSNHWAFNAIQTLNANKIVAGYDDRTFRPTQSSSRAEFSVFLYRAK